MRILEMITPSSIGGAEISLVNTARRLEASGDKAFLFFPAGRTFTQYLGRQVGRLQQAFHRVLQHTASLSPASLYKMLERIP